MKAVVIERPHEVAFVEIDTPSPAPGDVLVHSRVAGICRTDMEILHGGLTDPRWVTFPLVPGHEWSGTVAELGDGVTDLEVGDRVVCEGMVPCNRCRRCKLGETNFCEHYDQLGFTRGGGYGEYVVVPRMSSTSCRAPSPLARLCSSSRAPACCGDSNAAGHSPARRSASSGSGRSGRLPSRSRACTHRARSSRTGSGPKSSASPSGSAQMRRCTSASRTRCGDEPHRRGGPRPRDRDRGRAAAIELATRLVRPGGRVVLLGLPGEGQMLELPAGRITFGDMEVLGSFSYTTAVWTRVVDLLARGAVDFEPLVTHTFPAERFDEAFALMDAREAVVAKVLLTHTTASA